jgi:hypothetical protein
MSWIKTSFTWMMFRSNWGTREGQEATLAIWIRRPFFDTILAQAVHSTFIQDTYASEVAWRMALIGSQVRLQWDPDHDPKGSPLSRRAIQLGLRGDVLRNYAHEEIVEIADISQFVREQRSHVESSRLDRLATPVEAIYHVADPTLIEKLGISTPGSSWAGEHVCRRQQQ